MLQVFGSLGLGGAERRMLDVYRNFVQSDHVDFDFALVFSTDMYLRDEVLSLGGHVLPSPDPAGLGLVRHFFWMVMLLRGGKYDAVHAHTSYHGGLVAFAGWCAKTPVRVVQARTAGSRRHRSIGALISRSLGRLLIILFATHRLAVSKQASEFLFGGSAKGVELVPNPIDFRRYTEIEICGAESLRAEYGLDASDMVVGQIGRLQWIKNHEFTLRVFSALLQIAPAAKLVLIGDGELSGILRELAKERGIYDSVVFVGRTGAVREWLGVIDVLIHPSHFEGLPGVILEAQAAGIPCVASRAVTHEVDLGLNLVEFMSLESEVGAWVRALMDGAGREHTPSVEEINDAFQARGLTVEYLCDRLGQIYRGAR